MNSIKQDLITLSKEVNFLLIVYIEIHDAVFKFSLRHIIPLPLFFKALDYPSLQKQVIAITGQMRDKERKIKGLIDGSDFEQYSLDEKNYVKYFKGYISALIETLLRFETMLNELRKKMDDPKYYKYSSYQNHLEEYKEAISVYTSMGDKLNELYYQLI